MKRKAGEEIYAPHRERAVLQRVCRKNEGPLTNDSLRAIYREVMSSALSLEKSLTVAYLGPEATFTHQAAIRRFGASLRYTPQKTITDVFTEVSKHRADYGVVPVENSTEGVVTHTLDMFVDSDLQIVAQIVLPVQHCLLANCPRSQIRSSMPTRKRSANAGPGCKPTCRASRSSKPPPMRALPSWPPKKREPQPSPGVLASERYDVPVLDYDIQDNVANATRFLVLGRQCGPPTGDDRTSLMFSLADKVGALYNSLVAFRRYRINMTKIESRPSKRKAWEYIFFVDCEGHMEDRRLSKAISLLGEHCSYLKVLGSYPDSD